MKNSAYIQGFRVDILSYSSALDFALDSIRKNKNCHVVTINPEIIQCAKKKPDLKEIINNAELITADGVGVKIALKLKKINQNQITGVDFCGSMLEICAKNNIKTALIGAREEVITLAAEKIKEKYKGINIVYSHNGFFEDFDPIIDEVVKSEAKFIICAMGSPRQDYFIARLKEKIQGAVMIGAGGTLDVMSGLTKPAPAIYKKTGLEWLYRTIKEPKRIKRIFPALPIFFFQSIIDSMKSKN